jgi:hypothetical protein
MEKKGGNSGKTHNRLHNGDFDIEVFFGNLVDCLRICESHGGDEILALSGKSFLDNRSSENFTKNGNAFFYWCHCT